MDMQLEMKVTYVDPNGRNIFVAQVGGVWQILTQKDKQAPRRLTGKFGAVDGFATEAEAQKQLDSYVAFEKSENYGYRWDTLVNGKVVTTEELNYMRRGVMLVPTPMSPNAVVTLANIEYRIATHMQSTCRELLEVGACLNEAKDAGLVPHGEWESWVRKNTGMSERQAQRLMQASRSVPDGSSMALLSISKIQTILTLPEPERDAVAEKAVAEDMSLRELQAECERYKQQAATLATANNQANLRAAKAETKAFKTSDELEKARKEMEEERTLAEMLAREKALEEAREKYQKALDDQQARILALQDALTDATQESSEGQGISPEAQAEIDRLKQELEEAEAYAERQAEERKRAQMEMLSAQSAAARGEAAGAHDGLTGAELAGAVRTFIGSVGVLPHMGSTLCRISNAERQELLQYVAMVETWVDGAKQALGTIAMEA